MGKKIFITFVVCAIPIATIIITLFYHSSDAYQSPHFFKTFPPLITALAALTAVYSLFLAVLIAVLNWENRKLKNWTRKTEATNEEMRSQNRELQTRIELLSATREISLILNEDVDFDAILEKVLEVTDHLLESINPPRAIPGQSDTDEITIFFKDTISDQLNPKAQRKQNQTYFENHFKKIPADATNVKEAVEHNRILFLTEGRELDLTCPLVADREVIGALKIKTVIVGTQEEKSTQIRLLQTTLQEFVKILALAIKTPDLYQRAITDGLTNLFAKRHFLAQLHTYFEISRRHNEPLSLIMMDIDHFKNINDTYGHLTGDIILKETAKLLKDSIRATSSAYRYGGEELAVILPNTPLAGAMTLAERLRKKIDARKFTSHEGEALKITVSFGVAEYQKEMGDMKELLHQADTALYQAKETGRNKVCGA